MKKIRTAVIGLGRIGWHFHVPEIVKHSGFELVCVCDTLIERLKEAHDIYNVQTYSNMQDMLKREHIDLVVIASPTQFHVQQSIEAFKYGCDVFCDKPAATCASDGQKVFDLMIKNNSKFMVYQPHRTGSDIQCLKNILKKGLIGPVYMIKRTRCDYSRRCDWQAFREFGGGILNNYGSHQIDQLLHIVPSEIRNVHCITRKIASLGNAEDVAKILIETSENTILDLDINMASAFSLEPWIVFGKYGTAALNPDGEVWNVRYCKPTELTNLLVQKELAARGRKYSNGEKIKWYEEEFKLSDFAPINYYDECYNFFALGKEPLVPWQETLQLMQIIDLCKQQTYQEKETI
ncbi:MAG: hypothetical protein A2Y10_17615 [Planctomycetes bacterium GWF2_41_51]|nr:MAG: hypothetical protein A2Y10_17615 [Planctomycetes bacterium GWF2_41_51]HBG28045.1 hypothetical protein [Phycisphaerales bacterium]